jgi:muconolactone delta-isomerase
MSKRPNDSSGNHTGSKSSKTTPGFVRCGSICISRKFPELSDLTQQRSSADIPDSLNTSGEDLNRSNSQVECAICLEQVDLPLELACSHSFCYICIKGHLDAQRYHPTCPLCRAPIDPAVLLAAVDYQAWARRQARHAQRAGAVMYQWKYSGANGSWWLYDERSNQELETMYAAFLKHEEDKLAAAQAAAQAPIQNDSTVPAPAAVPAPAPAAVASSSDSDDDSDSVDSRRCDVCNETCSDCECSDCDCDRSDSDSNSVHSTHTTAPAPHVYTMRIGVAAYVIDFVHMTQAPVSDPRRQRKILRAPIDSIGEARGQAGVRFAKAQPAAAT